MALNPKQIKPFSSLAKTIKDSLADMQKQIPAVDKEALQLIKNNCTDIRTIEHYLDTLHSLHISGFKVIAHLQLIKYLSGLDKELAMWHNKLLKKIAE
jgi:hypothetical protein